VAAQGIGVIWVRALQTVCHGPFADCLPDDTAQPTFDALAASPLAQYRMFLFTIRADRGVGAAHRRGNGA
jgi:hypothetical protein